MTPSRADRPSPASRLTPITRWDTLALLAWWALAFGPGPTAAAAFLTYLATRANQPVHAHGR